MTCPQCGKLMIRMPPDHQLADVPATAAVVLVVWVWLYTRRRRGAGQDGG